MSETPIPLSAWESFYVIVGSSAAALTGLQFVVMTLIMDLRRRAGEREISAFATPTVIHFGAALVTSAILSAPWETLRGPAGALGILGVAGVVYTIVVTRRARRAEGYTPVLEDWIWHVALPFVAYGTTLVAAATFLRHERDALFAVAGATLLLLFIGIHNSWDTVTWVALGNAGEQPRESAGEPVPPVQRTSAPADVAAARDRQTPVELL
ncbi:MAG TPA: hypothetical protein VF761_09545 [Gemmatimonadaceae bacterium]